MGKKFAILLMSVVMLSLAGSVSAALPYYYWNSTSGDWASSIWGTDPVPMPAQVGGNQAMLLGAGQIVTVSTAGQGACDLIVGYAWPGTATLGVNAGIDFTITGRLMVGLESGNGVFNLYGTTLCEQLLIGSTATSSGAINIYDGGFLEVGSSGCTIGAGGTARIDLKGTGSMTVYGTTGIVISSLGRIDIEGGQLNVLGDFRTQLSTYISQGRITGYNGDATIAAPVYTDGYTVVAVQVGLTASAPNPSNVLSMVPLNKTLTWTAGSYATSHDVYLGTNSLAVANATHASPEFKGTYNTNSYTHPEAFAPGQTYYWRINEVNDLNVWSGNVWSFSTVHNGGVLLSGDDWLINSGSVLPTDSNWVMATVPGNIQSDLERQHLLDPLSYGPGDPRLVGVCQKEWWYKKSFVAPSDFSGKRTVIVFEGVDFSCQVWLNGTLLGQNAGMFRRFEFDVSNVILPGQTNTLVVKLDKMPDVILPYLVGSDGKGSGDPEYSYFLNGMNKTRQVLKDLKSPTNFSYDWGTNIWALGIWKDVRIEATGPARIEWVHVQSQLSNNYTNANVSVKLEINSTENMGAAKARFRITGNGVDIQNVMDITLANGNSVVNGQISLANPALWWPNGHGGQPLYMMQSSLEKADGTIIDTKSTRFGVREITWGQVAGAPADFYSPFMLHVNGRPIRMVGSSLFPDLLPGNTMISGPKLMQLARDGNLNTLRLNGGGGVLHEGMFDLADELGIMMIEEFPIGNAWPETDEVFLANLEVTARSIVKQVRNHPSIVEWGGGNEMAWGAGANHPAYLLFKRVVAEEDGGRMFRANCPIEGGKHGPYLYAASNYSYYNAANVMDQTGTYPVMRYGEYATETPANLEVWQRDIPLPSQWPIVPSRDCENPTLIRKNIFYGVGLYYWFGTAEIGNLFGEFDDLDGMIQAGQFIGAEGIRSASDALRRRGSSLGSMITHVFNEPWSNGAGAFHVDHDGVPLMNYYWLAEALEPVSISLKYNSITYNGVTGIDTELWVVSDLPEVSGQLVWKYIVRTSDGAVVDQGNGTVTIAPQECLKVRDLHINPPANLGPVFVELQVCDSSAKILTERVHVFGLDGVTCFFGGLLKNSASYSVPNEVEIPTSAANFAYVGNGALPATASSTINAELHKPIFINDGIFGNPSTWIGEAMSYFKINLGQVRNIGIFKIGRDRTGRYPDWPINYIKIEASLDNLTWNVIFEKSNVQAMDGYSPIYTLEIATQPVNARYLKVTLDSGGVDEFEVYAPRTPLPAQLPVAQIVKFASSWAVPVKRTSLTATMSILPDIDGKEAAKITLTNTGQMTALFCKLQPVLVYRTDLFLSDNFIIVPPGQSREIIVKSPLNPVCGLALSQTGWRVSSWNADDVVINASNDVLLSFGRSDSISREYSRACETHLIMDLNHDCYVDMGDLAIFAENWLNCTNPTDANCSEAVSGDNVDPGQYTVTVSGVRPDSTRIPWIVTPQSKLRCIVNVSGQLAAQGAALYINTADQSKSETANIVVSINDVEFTSLLPKGFGRQNTVPYYLCDPYTAKIDIPAGVLHSGDNVIEIKSAAGWFTWDACYLVATGN